MSIPVAPRFTRLGIAASVLGLPWPPRVSS